MKNRQGLVMLFAVVTMIFSSCGKYDDGPFFSIYSKKERASGFWWFEKVVVDGVNQTENYIEQSLQVYKNGIIVWNQGYINNNPYYPITVSGKWNFRNDENNLLMTFNPGAANEFSYDWTIKRLAYAEMWLEISGDAGKTQWRMLKR